jgi:uncharacterized repeat protein (TIGR01451 family)
VAPTAHAQGSIPALRGVYQGSGSTMNCVAGGQAHVTVSITSQVNANFNGQAAATDGAGATVFLSGTVDSAGNLQGTYEYSVGDTSGQGTFTGKFDPTVVPKTLHLDLTGTITALPLSCGEKITIDAVLLTAGGASADLSITGSVSPTPAATGKSITYSLTVANAGPNDATATLAVNPAPVGAFVVNATSSQGVCSATPGNASCSLGTVPKGGSVSITVTANVYAPPGSTLVSSPSVSSNVFDSNLSNNTTSISTPVVGGALAKLKWNQQQSAGGSSTPAPTGLQVQPGGLSSTTSESWLSSSQSVGAGATGSAPRSAITPMDSCSLSNVNVYKSDQANVQPVQANLFSRVAGNALETVVPIAPNGSSYVITNLFQCGTSTIESAVSNEVDVPPGPVIAGLKVTGKLKILGSGFSGQVQVFIDGVAFVKAAVVVDSTLLIQKGPLTDGTAIADIGTANSVLVTVKNGDGGFASFVFKR